MFGLRVITVLTTIPVKENNKSGKESRHTAFTSVRRWLSRQPSPIGTSTPAPDGCPSGVERLPPWDATGSGCASPPPTCGVPSYRTRCVDGDTMPKLIPTRGIAAGRILPPPREARAGTSTLRRASPSSLRVEAGGYNPESPVWGVPTPLSPAAPLADGTVWVSVTAPGDISCAWPVTDDPTRGGPPAPSTYKGRSVLAMLVKVCPLRTKTTAPRGWESPSPRVRPG